ncbi:transporter substrate-binding domain-containing protein [Proteiniborus sp.]|uniref:transporter substrate-binding domain-containing protein n=1 Tax=Proteiniborus sp. TaxID=2079015 RepID=UPI00332A8170
MCSKKQIIIFILIFAIFSITSIAYGVDETNLTSKVIRIAGDNNYPPYEFVDKDGNYKGFNVDIMRAVAIELGIEIELVPTSWERAIYLLREGEIDAIQGMTKTPLREEMFDFTQELVTNSQNIFVMNNTTHIAALEDLAGVKVSFQAGDVTDEILAKVPDIIPIEKENQKEAIDALFSGEVEAFMGNRLTGIYYIQKEGLAGEFKIVGEPMYVTQYCSSVKKGNIELLTELNKGIDDIKKNGTYDKIYKKWFGEEILESGRKWRQLLYISLLVLLVASIIIGIIIYWNRSLRREVENRAKEIKELYELAKHDDKMRALGKLSAGVAHELRNPLTSIKVFIDMLPNKLDNPEFVEELTKIVPMEINRLNSLVNTLLDYSKPKVPVPKENNLKDILTEILVLLKQKINEKKIIVEESGTNIWFLADTSQFKQIMINIILNSIDAIKEKGIISITGRIEEKKAIIIIKDNGIGMSEDVLSKVYEPFFTSKKSGYGIGLSITHQLVKENKGEISIDSTEGVGTTTTISLPTA